MPVYELQMATMPSRSRSSSAGPRAGRSATVGRLRSASQRLLEANPPLGFLQATGAFASNAPTISDIRNGNFDEKGWNAIRQRESHRGSVSASAWRQNVLSRRNTVGNRQLSMDQGEVEVEIELVPELECEPESEPEREMSSLRENDDGAAFETEPFPDINEGDTCPVSDRTSIKLVDDEKEPRDPLSELPDFETSRIGPDEYGVFPNGYHFPPKQTWVQSTMIALKAFWAFFLTPLGFFVTVYGLNVVAWGGMLFLLLCNAAPAMCHPSCNDINSSRRIWIEIDSQILNALFCVTGFGLIPWRFRDFYYLLQFRIMKKYDYLRKLAGFNQGWFRLPGSDFLPVEKLDAEVHLNNKSVPIPVSKAPNPPPTGIRAPPTALWKLDFVIWMYVLNTLLQAVLSGFMWGMNRHNRPSWSTGLFVALACSVAAIGGLVTYLEGRRVKGIEGVPYMEENGPLSA